MNTKFLTFILTFLLCTTLAVADDNTLTLHYYNEDNVPVNDVAVWLFECTNSSCSELTSTLTEDLIDFDDSRTSNSVTLTLPETSKETFYVAYAFAEDTDTYLPHAYYGFSFDGGNVEAEEDLTLEKKDECTSTIQAFSITEIESIGEPVTISADIVSAFEYDDSVYPWGYDASADAMTWYQDWYSAETEVTFTIYREFTISILGIEKTFRFTVYITTETVNIRAGETASLDFSWTPTKAGTYTTTVTTDVVDVQCASSKQDSQSLTFIVEEKDDETKETPDWPDWDIEEPTFPSFDIDPTISSCSATPNHAVIDEEIDFEATPYFLTGLLDVAYIWDFGDGEIASGQDVTHTYTAAGMYTAIVTATDADDGVSDRCTVTVEITEPAEESPLEEVPIEDDPVEEVPIEESIEESEDLPAIAVIDADENNDIATVAITVADELENIAGRHYYIGGIALSNNGNIHAGETLEIYVRAENLADVDKNAVAYHAIIQELGLYATSGEFALDAGDAEAAILSLDIPAHTVPGIYNIRITISDDDVKRIVYRDVIVLS